MSSYEVGGVDLGASIIAGPIAIGASIAILAPIVGGYAILAQEKQYMMVWRENIKEHWNVLHKSMQGKECVTRKQLKKDNK